MTDKIFANGLIVKERKPQTPEYVIANLSVKVDEFIQTLKDNESSGWVNIALLVAKSGKSYAEIDTWKPTQGDSAKAGIKEARAAAEPVKDFAGFDDLEDTIPF